MRCDYFAAGVCRSCTFLETPYAAQLAAKQTRVAATLTAVAPGLNWKEPMASAESGFRNKAKMVVAGTTAAPTLGILSPDGRGIDLRDCGLHSAGLHDALPALAAFVTEAGVTPYSVPARAGELKHLIVTESPDGELMVRFVLRSREALARLRGRLPGLLDALPVAVASINLQPEHKAILEGPEEVPLHGETLRMRLNGIDLHLRPQSFFQTNTAVAAALYRSAAALVAEVDPASVWDLYCGVGGFGLHAAAPGRQVVGVEVSEQAVASARRSAAELRGSATATGELSWVAADATSWALAQDDRPELVIVNPPRRGIGAELAGWLETSGVPHVLYSSCNVDSLARDLAAMPSLRPLSARLLDMFPHTGHHEVLVHLAR
jgi:23S rRNA (uracil747-C5)-methyltransferase